MAERNIVPNLETKATDGNTETITPYLHTVCETPYLHRDNGLKGSGSFVNGNTKLTLIHY